MLNHPKIVKLQLKQYVIKSIILRLIKLTINASETTKIAIRH